MIGVTVYGGASTIVGNLPIVNGILACGVILILISVLGLVGAVKHHQVMLFFVSITSVFGRQIKTSEMQAINFNPLGFFFSSI